MSLSDRLNKLERIAQERPQESPQQKTDEEFRADLMTRWAAILAGKEPTPPDNPPDPALVEKLLARFDALAKAAE